jgi:hypothetical protein
LKELQKNTGKTLEDAGKGNAFLNRTPIAWEIELTSGIASDLKASAQQRKQLLGSRDNLQNGKKSLSAIYWIKY